jgi:hypothetical protein
MLSEIANLAEIFGALAVLVSLIYVGYQVKQNTSAVRSATAQEVHNNYAVWYQNVASDAALSEVSLKGLQDYSSLTDLEKIRFVSTFMAFLSYSQNAFFQYTDGLLSNHLWEGWVFVMMNLLSTPGGGEFWGERSYMFSQEFQGFVTTEVMTREPHENARSFGVLPIPKQGDV